MLKAELAPKHTQQVGNYYVLWFESTNSYVVMSTPAFLLLSYYIDAKDKATFTQEIQESYNITSEQAASYYAEFSGFLEEVGMEHDIIEPKSNSQSIPTPSITKNYAVGAAHITINYASENLLHLIHPYLEYAALDHDIAPDTEFDLFKGDELLYLFKNKLFIGSYDTKSVHLLQGKFSMELVTAIYHNSESDWLATFHASTVCNDKEAIMIIGDSGNGKSTLAAILMANGFDLLADDFTPMLSLNQHVYRFPAAISIKPGAVDMIESLFSGFKDSKLHMSSSKPTKVKYLPPSAAFKTSQKHFPCNKLVTVKYTSSGPSELKGCDPAQTLQKFIPDSWISPDPEHSKQFLNWLKDLKFYELTYNDNEYAVTKFHELFAL